MYSAMILSYVNTSPFLMNCKIVLQDRLEQLYRKGLRYVRPFRYVNFIRILKIAHHGLFLYGVAFFWVSNRLLGGSGNTRSTLTFFRKQPNTWPEAYAQLTWGFYVFLGGGFPFYWVRHPTRASWFRNWAHPMFYWGFLGLYKCIWSTWNAVTIANLITDPRRNPPPRILVSHKANFHPKWNRLWKSLQQERIVKFQNLRYQHQWSGILQELNNAANQRLVKTVRIDNRWVALGGFGAAGKDRRARSNQLCTIYRIASLT